ncbi:MULTISPECIES: hypothetical protein [unclassified Hydrogenophaga]|uniref:hypothetical protein n=1 Tax=unclassified Hydrogenophaga TaxID=2610897 RepID=UPI000877F155|nr:MULTISPECIES: hypothetical protein [unclassified Hydrogenophaga]MBN9370925.1 hypothetical protein [Hydrogenophaga sp.]OJV35617.1 MAG: hypothetical protein BGO22_12230 [Hydrogenophaga sp. 70-12]
MTLLEAITRYAPPDETDELRSTLQARLRYLLARAEGLHEAGRAPDMAIATLWLDACETASFLGDDRAARRALRGAARALTLAGNPFGETLRAAFLGRSPPRFVASEGVDEVAPVQGAERAWAVFNSAQRQPWNDEAQAAQRSGFTGAERFGRLGWTQDELLSVLTEGREQRRAFFATHLLAQFHALRAAQRNTDLWRRQLAPVALFDMELAVLIRHGLAERWGEVSTPWTAQTVEDPERRDFMRAYLDSVSRLIEPEPGGELPIRVEQPV